MSGININVRISAEDLRAALMETTQEQVMETILAIDLSLQDAGFTEELIKRLAQSLRGDMAASDWLVLCTELMGMQP